MGDMNTKAACELGLFAQRVMGFEGMEDEFDKPYTGSAGTAFLIRYVEWHHGT